MVLPEKYQKEFRRRNDRVGENRMVLFSDIDNTLVYSHHHNINEPKVVVEYFNGRQQAYMTKKSYMYFKQKKDVMLVPVTSRCVKQYKRLLPFVDGSFGVKYALLCNGGILLRNHVVDDKWQDVTMKISGDSFAEIDRCYRIMKRKVPESHIHYIEPFFVYAVSGETEIIVKFLKENLDAQKVNVWQDGRKIYCCAVQLSKGKSVKRLIQYLGLEDITFSAGDNIIDTSMFDVTDISFAKQELKQVAFADNVIYLQGDLISNQICDILQEKEEMKNDTKSKDEM
jgi:hypothetical protein